MATRAPAGEKFEQLLLIPVFGTAGGARPPVALRARRKRLYLCGPELPRYMAKVAKFRAPKFEAKYVHAHYDCLAQTQSLDDVSLAAQQKVAAKLRKAGIPAQVEVPEPQAAGPIRWSAPDQHGVIMSELVRTEAQGAGYYTLGPGMGGVVLMHHDNIGGSGAAGHMLKDGKASYPLYKNMKAAKASAERHLELANQETGWVYEDWERSRGDVASRALIRWRGGGRGLPPIPYSTFYDVMKFGTKEEAAAYAKFSDRQTLIGPKVAVDASPIRVYEWDAVLDGRLRAPAMTKQRSHGAWALTPDGKALLTRWAKNAPVKRR